MSISTWNPATGSFSGTGYYKPDTSVTWTMTGSITGSSFNLTFLYTGSNPGYMGTVNGTVDSTLAPVMGNGANSMHVFTWTAARAP
jgi:hypothetical protein